VSDIVLTFRRREEAQRDRDELGDVIETARSEGTQKRFQFREREFDRIEVRTVGRQETEARAGACDGGVDLRLLVHREVIQDDHIAGSQRRHQHLFDVGEKTLIVDRPIEHGGRSQALGPQRRDHRLRLPMTARGVVVEARAAEAPTIAAQEVGRHPALVDEDVLACVAQRQPGAPLTTLGRDVSSPLFVGVDGFF